MGVYMESLKRYCLVSGTGSGQYKISSFDSALISAKVGKYNLVRVSSILPPCCKESSVVDVASGSVLFIAYAVLTVKAVAKIASAVAVAIPEKPEDYGVIIEYSDYTDKNMAVNVAEHLAESAMGKRGIPIKKILSIGIDTDADEVMFYTTFAGIALFN